MEPLCAPWLLIVAAIVLVGALGTGIVVLLKLGVIAKYALKEEAPDQGSYDLEQSQEAAQKESGE